MQTTLTHPTKAQFQTVIDNLKSVLPQATKDEQLDMLEGGIYDPDNVYFRPHVCGTTHCMAGWDGG